MREGEKQRKDIFKGDDLYWMKKRVLASVVSYSPVCGQSIATPGILGPLRRGRREEVEWWRFPAWA